MGGYQYCLGTATADEKIIIKHQQKVLLTDTRANLQALWSETSFRMQALRDNPHCAEQEFATIREQNPGLSVQLSYDPAEDIAAPTSQWLLNLKLLCCVSKKERPS